MNDNYSMVNDDNITLSTKPASETELTAWAEQLAEDINARIREYEEAADQYCWRLSINEKHWLLFYSALCEAAWLQPLEGNIDAVVNGLRDKGYVN